MQNRNSHIFMPEDHMESLYNSRNPIIKFVHCQRLDVIKHSMPAQKGIKVLDVGCGEGHLIKKLHGQNPDNIYYGIDITDIAISKAKERCPFAILNIMDSTKIKCEDNFFDVIIITEVLEHIYNYKLALSEIKRVLSPKGTLIVTFPNEKLWTAGRFLLRRRPIKVPDHVNSFTPKLVKNMLDMKPVKQNNLPFGLFFSLSLGCCMVFRK